MRMPRLFALVVLLVACAWAAAAEPVLRQAGELEQGDSTLPDGRWVDWFKVSLTAGSRYLVGVKSDDIDTAVLLRFADGAVLSNNDFDGWDPGVVYTAVRSESVEVGVANALDPAIGDYEVTVEKVGPARAVAAGHRLSRTIAADPASSRGWKAESLLLTGARGERVTITAHSSSFDPLLRVQGRSGYWEEIDDSGSGTDAALSCVFLEQGPLEIIIRGANPADGGAYELQIGRHPPAQTLRTGADVKARMRAGTDLYLLEGRRGDTVDIMVESEQFDPAVRLVDRLGRRAASRDYDGRRTARLLHVFADEAPVAIAVLRGDDGDPAAYRLSVEPSRLDAEAAAAGDRTALSSGDVVRGHLGAADISRGNRYLDRYTFEAELHQVVRLELSSGSFDAFLELVAPDGSVVEDDDSLGGYNALLQSVCTEAGPYTVRVTSAGEWEAGSYELAFTGEGTAEPLAETLGSLDQRDQRDISGRRFDTYTFDLDEGQSLIVEMIASEFDAYLYVWDPGGAEIYADDDGGGQTNARLSLQGTAAGRWTVYATSAEPGETGGYTLRVLTY